MAINPQSQYPGKIAPASSSYPYGQARNITVPGDGTGTPWEAALVNDLFGFQQAVLSQAGIVPSGSPDTVLVSQYLDAIRKITGILAVDYDEVRALDSSNLSDGDLVTVANELGVFKFTVRTGTVTDNDGRYLVFTDDSNRYVEIADPYVTLNRFGGPDGSGDYTDALTAFAAAYPTGGVSVKIEGTVKFETGDVALPGNICFWGDGQGISKMEVDLSSNPGSDRYIGRFTDVNNILFVNLSLSCTAAAQGIFNLGSLQGDGTYSPDQAGHILGLRIAGCENVVFDRVEVVGFNGSAGVLFTNTDGVENWNRKVKILSCNGHDNRETPFSLQAVDDYEIVGGSYTDNGLQVFDSVDADGNPTSTTRTATNFIDGGTGYGIVIGRATTATKLATRNGRCVGVYTARNVRHGIDLHAGTDVELVDCVSEDDLLTAWGFQDTSAVLAAFEGDIAVNGGRINHTVYSENRGYLFDNRTAGVERDDSNPIFMANIASRWNNCTVDNVRINNWRFRQISSYSATDTIMAITISANEVAEATNIKFTADIANYYPSKVLQLTAGTCRFSGRWKYGTRGDFDRAAFRWSSSEDNSEITNNVIQEINVYSTGTTEVAHPVFEKTDASDLPVFVSNNITRTTQTVKGSLCETTSGNAQYGYRGFWGTNKANILDGEEYASEVGQDKTFYISDSGAGNQDGSSAGNAFAANNAANLQLIVDQLPQMTRGAFCYLQFEDASYGLSGQVEVAFDQYELLGNAAEFGAATTKSVDLGVCKVIFPVGASNTAIRGIETEVSSGHVIDNAADVEGCVARNTGSTSAADNFCIYITKGKSTCLNNYVDGGRVGIGAVEAAEIVSINNQTTGTTPERGLETNSALIMKNGTQPTGSVSAERNQNGGTIR